MSSPQTKLIHRVSKLKVNNKSSVEKKEDKPSSLSDSSENVEVISELPEVKRRLKALKKLQFEKLKLDGELEKVFLELIKTKFHDKFQRIYQRRAQIVNGSDEPTDEECDFELDSEDSDSEVEVKEPKVEGIPHFWLRALQNFGLIRDWITKEDESVLYHLKDIRVIYNEKPPKLILEFTFGPNEYFTNEILRKEYEIKFGPNPQLDWEITPYYAVKRKGCPIDWKDSTNFGRKMRKNLKNSIKDSDDNLSFFDFFSPPKEEKEYNEDIEDQLSEDWQIALSIVKCLVPNAVLCYTGDLCDDESESESSDDYDEESDPLESPKLQFMD